MSDVDTIASLLPSRAINALARCGIYTVDQLKANYPEKLLRIHGFGMLSLRIVEKAFFPDQRYDPIDRPPEIPKSLLVMSEVLAQDLERLRISDFEGLR